MTLARIEALGAEPNLGRKVRQVPVGENLSGDLDARARRSDGERRVAGDPRGERERRIPQQRGVDDLIKKADSARLVGVDPIGREQEVARMRGPHQGNERA